MDAQQDSRSAEAEWQTSRDLPVQVTGSENRDFAAAAAVAEESCPDSADTGRVWAVQAVVEPVEELTRNCFLVQDILSAEPA